MQRSGLRFQPGDDPRHGSLELQVEPGGAPGPIVEVLKVAQEIVEFRARAGRLGLQAKFLLFQILAASAEFTGEVEIAVTAATGAELAADQAEMDTAARPAMPTLEYVMRRNTIAEALVIVQTAKGRSPGHDIDWDGPSGPSSIKCAELRIKWQGQSAVEKNNREWDGLD